VRPEVGAGIEHTGCCKLSNGVCVYPPNPRNLIHSLANDNDKTRMKKGDKKWWTIPVCFLPTNFVSISTRKLWEISIFLL